ncbi:transglutaminase-like putative cysteine protease [Hymenobacter luteus]|uniref:Transglutaminase-like putative cysteine protease n=2 Tax=Hymenobacter TaxID=89966 RepID=A0A7W9SXD7_9BACT|nr:MULTISPECIES: transglutaminase domain-containing protein [Hymenobacter]MBB4600065.1 transglutaminase-like putative cysteine protease [Hymenobacter latericoloratus]MBB6057625.1 transglutaminase-like putative cysteine protease [Hymenobacter luteus]
MKPANLYRQLGGLALALLLALSAQAQQPLQLLQQLKQQYPTEPAVYLDYRQDVTVEVKGDSVQVLARHRYDMLHLGSQSAMYAPDQVYTSHFNRLQKLEARTLLPATNDYKPIKVTEFKDKFDIRPGVFFDDARIVSFTYPAVAPGARTVCDYTIRQPDARFVSPFYFASYVPIRHAELVITAPRGVRINAKQFHIPEGLVTYTRQEKGSNVIYRWTAENLPAAPREADAPEAAYYLPHLAYFLEEATVNGQPRALLGGVKELYSLYSGFVSGLDKQENPALRRVVDSLTAGARTEPERVARIYYWVQDHVRYIAFENGLRGFIPHDAGRVYANRYGDCKDMANLLHEMLRMTGAKAYRTWIGTRDLPYHYAELATPGVDNHMITTYEPRPGEYVFLDATSKYTPYGMPSWMIQGKDALLALDGTTCKVVSVPVMERQRNRTVDSSVVVLDGTTGLRGSGRLALGGYTKVRQAYALDGLNQAEEAKLVKGLLERGNNKFFVDKYAVQHLDARDQPLVVDYQYRLQDYVQRLDDEVYVNLNLDQTYATDRLDPSKRRLARTNDYYHTTRTRTEFEVPTGYEVTYLPASTQGQAAVLGFSIRYERQGNKIIQEKELYVNYLLLEPAQFGQWNGVVDKLNAAYRDAIILKRKKA